MFNPEAWSEELEEFEKTRKAEAEADAEAMADYQRIFGLDEETAFQFAISRPVHQEAPIEELLAYFS